MSTSNSQTPSNSSAAPFTYPPSQAPPIPSSLLPGQASISAPPQNNPPPFRRPSQVEKSNLNLPRRSPSMSARAQREMMKRETYHEQQGSRVDALHDGRQEQDRQHQPMQSVDSGYGSSSKSEDYEDSRMYSLDINRNAVQRPVRPTRPGDHISNMSYGAGHMQQQPYDTHHYQPYTQGGHAEQGHPQPLAKRLSQSLGKRLSMASFRGEAAPLTEADEKRLEEEKMLKAEEERQLDEEEKEMLKRGLFNWSELKSWRFWIRKEWWKWYIILAICAVVAALFTIYHDQIVKWLTPYAQKLKELPGGWAIPIGVIFVVSFPPLFGGEVVCLLCGLVWGLWIGFAIVCAGTFLGEMGNFFLFKYTLRGYAAKLERKNLNYALMAHVIREGGFKVAMIARFSAIPGHFLTAIFSTCGMSVISFALGTALSLPKQLAIVYLGVLIGAQDQSSKDKIVSYTVLAVGAIVTLGAMWYIYAKMNKAKMPVWRARRAALADKGVDLSTLPKEPPMEDGMRNVSRPALLATTSLDETTDPILYNAQAPAGSPLDRTYSTPYDKSGYSRGAMASQSSIDVTGREVDMGSIAMQDLPTGRTHSRAPNVQFPEPKPYVPAMGRQASSASAFTTAIPPPGYLDPPMTQFPEPRSKPPAQTMTARSSEDFGPEVPLTTGGNSMAQRISLVDNGPSRI